LSCSRISRCSCSISACSCFCCFSSSSRTAGSSSLSLLPVVFDFSSRLLFCIFSFFSSLSVSPLFFPSFLSSGSRLSSFFGLPKRGSGSGSGSSSSAEDFLTTEGSSADCFSGFFNLSGFGISSSGSWGIAGSRRFSSLTSTSLSAPDEGFLSMGLSLLAGDLSLSERGSLTSDMLFMMSFMFKSRSAFKS